MGGIALSESHQDTMGALAYLTEGNVSPTGARSGMEQRKAKLKTLETTTFSEMLSSRIVFKLKKLGAKFCNFESRRFK